LSPISGHVTAVSITRGAFLSPSQTAITIVNTEHLHLELSVFEKDLSKLAIGQPIQFRIQEDMPQSYPAYVHLINKRIDAENRTIRVHGHLSDTKLAARLSPGMYVEADIFTSSVSKAALPMDAVVEVAGKSFVLVVKDSTDQGYVLTKKEIKPGVSAGGFVEILNSQDFKAETQFLVKGAFNLITE
jgi:cobalt-zinc-cadmium efflux system membrane fusion protein